MSSFEFTCAAINARKSRLDLLKGLCAASLLITVASVTAQEAQPSATPQNAALEEVLVTATKRDGSLRDIAGSVGAVGGEQLERMQAQGMEDYLKLVPGVTLIEGSVDGSIPIIRGIATSIDNGFTSLSVGTFLEDIPFQDLFFPLSIPNLHPFDLARVEVLKGPQGTLFGSGALSGAVRYIPNKPLVGEWEAKLQHSVSKTREGSPGRTTAGLLNVPLGDDAGLRAMLVKRHIGGFYDVRVEEQLPLLGNLPGLEPRVIRDEKDVDQADQDSVRIGAKWDVNDRLTLSALYFEQESEQEDHASYANQTERPERDDSPFASPRYSQFGGLNLGAIYELDWFDITYSGNLLEKETYQTLSQIGALGQSHQDILDAPNTLRNDVDGRTNEIRFSSKTDTASPWTWLLGVARIEYNQNFFQFFTVGQSRQPPPEGPEDVSDLDKITSQLFATIDGEAVENAVFGEVSRLFWDQWELTLGARKFKTDLHVDTVITGAQIVALTGQQESRNSFDIKSDGINPKVSLRYLFSDEIQFFALAAKGFQFGGVQLNPPAPLFVSSAEEAGYNFGAYDSSTLWNYELGVRTEWFDQRLRVDGTLFYMDWTDLQLTVNVPVTEANPLVPSVGFGVIANVGEAHSQGAELAVDALPWSWLRLTSSVSRLEAETDVPFDKDHDDGPVPAGTPLPGAAKWQVSNVIALNFDLPYTENWDSSFTLTHTYMDKAPNAIRQTAEIGGYNTYDLRFIVSNNSHRFRPSLTVGVNNLRDTRGISAQNEAGPEDYQVVGFIRPRTVSATLDFTF